MKKLSVKKSLVTVRCCIAVLLLVIISLFLFSFTTNKLNDDFLQQLGISKLHANEKISNSFLGGYLDQYGVSNAKNIALGKRAAVVKDLIVYTKQYVNSPAFVKAYQELKASRKPRENTIQSPEEFRKQIIDQYKKSIVQTETTLKKMDGAMKKSLEDALASTKKELKQMEDGTSEIYVSYKENYALMTESNASLSTTQVEKWEAEFPDNHLLFIKKRLEAFINETSDVDYGAALVEKGGVKYFVNKAYEHKGDRWKMAYRAGKDAMETARTMVQQWMNEIK